MRTIEDIKNELRANFVADEVLSAAYALDSGKTFDDQFSAVSIEAIITYIVAVCIWVFERTLHNHQITINNTIAQKAICSIPWYHQMALDFQIGDFITLDENTYRWGYPEIHQDKKIIKYASVRTTDVEGVSRLRMYVSKDGKQPLSASELQAFETYIREVGAAGTHFEIISKAPTPMSFDISIVRDPMLMDHEGKSLSDGSDVISTAITLYLDTILYGGTFNRTKMIDALQSVPGVRDVILTAVRADGQVIYGQDFESAAGSFTFVPSKSSISYRI